MTNFVRVLVTGGAGFIGRNLVKTLLKDRKYKLTIIDDLSNSSLETFCKFVSDGDSRTLYQCLSEDRLAFHKVDIRNKEALKRIFEKDHVDVCVHLAARVSVTASARDPESLFTTNIEGTRNLLSLSSRTGIQNFVFASSAAVYGNSRCLPTAEDSLTEPISPYGKSKLLGEQVAAEYSGKIRNVTCLRVFNVYGADQLATCTRVLSKFTDRISNGLPPIIYGDGKQTRDFVSVEDVVRSILLAGGLYVDHIFDSDNQHQFLDLQRRIHEEIAFMNGNIFNVGTGAPTTILDVATLMTELISVAPRTLEPIYKDALELDIVESCADTRKSGIILGFFAKDTLRSGLARMLSTDSVCLLKQNSIIQRKEMS